MKGALKILCSVVMATDILKSDDKKQAKESYMEINASCCYSNLLISKRLGITCVVSIAGNLLPGVVEVSSIVRQRKSCYIKDCILAEV